MIPFTSSLFFRTVNVLDGKPVPGRIGTDWRATMVSSSSPLFHSMIAGSHGSVAHSAQKLSVQDDHAIVRPNFHISRNSQGFLDIRIRRSSPTDIVSPKNDSPISLPFIADEKVADQRPSISEEARHSGRAVTSGRFFSLHKNYQRRRSRFRFTNPENGVLVDETYQGPATCLLQHADSWNFNTFTLDHLTNGRALFHLGVHLFEDYGLVDYFGLDHLKLMKCFGLLEASYHSTNPFHNSIHAADVLQAIHVVMKQQEIQGHLSKLEIMSALLAAAGHDVDHPGVNQPFLVGTRNYLAALYNNKSVLENHHWRTSTCLIRQSGVLDCLSADDQRQCEETIKAMILATDITQQPDLNKKFHKFNNEKTFEEIMDDPVDRVFILRIMLKCADVNNPCRPWAICRIWSQRCVQEFFKQGDRERRLSLPVTAVCDRTNNNLPRIQVGFIKYVVGPLIDEWSNFFHSKLTTNMTKHLHSNLSKWELLAVADEVSEVSQPTPTLSEPSPRILSQRDEIKEWTSEVPLVAFPVFPLHSRRSLAFNTSRRHSLPPRFLLPDKRARTTLHIEPIRENPRGRRHSAVPSDCQVRFSTTDDPFVDRVSFSPESRYRTTEHRPSWSTEDVAPRMSRITSLTGDIEVSRISSAVTAETDSETDDIGPVFGREDSSDDNQSRRPSVLFTKSESEIKEEEEAVSETEDHEEDKENDGEGTPEEATLYYDWNARRPKYFQRKIKEEDEQVELAPFTLRQHSDQAHEESNSRRSIPSFLSLFPGGMSVERLVARRRSDPVSPPVGIRLAAMEEEHESPPATLLQRRRGSEPVDLLNGAKRLFLQGLHHSISASSVAENADRSSSRSGESSEQRRRSHDSSSGTGGWFALCT